MDTAKNIACELLGEIKGPFKLAIYKISSPIDFDLVIYFMKLDLTFLTFNGPN